jgi:hypothetical protein
MLIRFAIFNLEGNNNWLLPTNIDPVPQTTPLCVFRGGYRTGTKLAIEEIGPRKQWQRVVPNIIDHGKRKLLVWRDGMSEYILELFREAVWKGLCGLPRSLIFHASMDEHFDLVQVGRNVGKRVKLKKVGNVGNDAEEHSQASQSEEGHAPTNQTEQEPAEQTIQSEQEHAVQTIQEQSSSNGDITTDSPPETDFNQPPITAVFFKGPSSFMDEWEFKLIKIENQSTYATLFNIRRLLPVNTEEFFARFGTSDAVAVASSELWVPRLVTNMLRLSFYIKGDVNANVTLDMVKEREKRAKEEEEEKRNVRGPLHSGEEAETEEEILQGWKEVRAKVESELIGSRIDYNKDNNDT